MNRINPITILVIGVIVGAACNAFFPELLVFLGLVAALSIVAAGIDRIHYAYRRRRVDGRGARERVRKMLINESLDSLTHHLSMLLRSYSIVLLVSCSVDTDKVTREESMFIARFLYAFGVNSALSSLGISPMSVNPDYKMGLLHIGKEQGHSPQEIAVHIASHLPAVDRVELTLGPIRKWVRKRKINPNTYEMKEAFDKLGIDPRYFAAG